jgi:hypothetical protein
MPLELSGSFGHPYSIDLILSGKKESKSGKGEGRLFEFLSNVDALGNASVEFRFDGLVCFLVNGQLDRPDACLIFMAGDGSFLDLLLACADELGILVALLFEFGVFDSQVFRRFE